MTKELPPVHYFDKEKADPMDIQLKMCIRQGYVPATCLLAGAVVYSEVVRGNDPCAGCQCDRKKCEGRLP
ncbi:hypothetical protein LCGC14_2607630 [marine sediment metagenome]|uniref:Uncharacterized protein n=1 Tax=marine sediment metagenome TaxID=412755 RepID=A0A0F9A745_9ZZZZ